MAIYGAQSERGCPLLAEPRPTGGREKPHHLILLSFPDSPVPQRTSDTKQHCQAGTGPKRKSLLLSRSCEDLGLHGVTALGQIPRPGTGQTPGITNHHHCGPGRGTNIIKDALKTGTVAEACHPRTQEADTGGLLRLQDHPGLTVSIRPDRAPQQIPAQRTRHEIRKT